MPGYRGDGVIDIEVEAESNKWETIHHRTRRQGGPGGAFSSPQILFNSHIGVVRQLKTVQSGSTGTMLPPAGQWIDSSAGHTLKRHPLFTVTVHSKADFTTFNTSNVVPGPGRIAQRLYTTASGALTQGSHRLQFWTSTEGPDGITRFYQAFCSADANDVIVMKLYLTHGATSSGFLECDSQESTTIEMEPWLQTQVDGEAASAFQRDLIRDLHNPPLGFLVRDFTSVSDVLDQKTCGDHHIGTTKLGAVVDGNTRLYGTENLVRCLFPDLHLDPTR